MNSRKLVSQIEKDLMAKRDLEYKKGSKNFFKEPVNPIGTRAADTRKIAAIYYKDVKNLPKKEFFEVCEVLLKAPWMEQQTIAFDWPRRATSIFEEKDFGIFERWLKKYVSNWAHCDDFCTHAFGALLYQYPKLFQRIKTWTGSKNRWLRRASAVILIYPIARGDKKWLKNAFAVADKLLLDENDLVQKGYGWMLKVAADVWQKEVFDYVMKNKNRMPRTALRYAIEKMPKDMKKRAMVK